MEHMPGFNVDNHRSSESTARAMCMHAHFFTLYISTGCEWTPHQSIFTRKLYVLVEGWENPSLWMVKLNYVFVFLGGKMTWSIFLNGLSCPGWPRLSHFSLQLCYFDVANICWWTTRHIQQITWISFLKGKTSSFMIKLAILW